MFTEEEVIAVRDAHTQRTSIEVKPYNIRALMEETARILAAHGGTMTAEELEKRLGWLEDDEWEDTAAAIRGLVAAQGATVATLQAKVEELERDALRAEVERLKAPLPTKLHAAVEAWLGANRLSSEQVRHGLFPLGMVQRWVERAVTAESRLAAIREIVQRVLATGQYMAQTLAGLTHHPALKTGGHIEAHGQINSDWADVAYALRGWLNAPAQALERGAPQEPPVTFSRRVGDPPGQVTAHLSGPIHVVSVDATNAAEDPDDAP